MLTKKGYSSLISELEATGGFTDEMKGQLHKLQGELDEREGILSTYGEAYDGEADEYDFKAKPVEDYRDQYNSLKAEFDGLSARYRDMLENPHGTHETDESVDEGDGDYTDTDYSNVRISDLIIEKE